MCIRDRYCIATDNTLIGLIEVLVFLLIRKYSGGYHCQSSTVCLVFSVIVLITMAWLSSVLKPSLFLFIALIIADVELVIKGPIISINHSVSDTEKKYYHRRSSTQMSGRNRDSMWKNRQRYLWNCRVWKTGNHRYRKPGIVPAAYEGYPVRKRNEYNEPSIWH